MFRLVRRLVTLAAAAVVLFVLVPAAPLVLPARPAGLPAGVRGALHIHTERSDGTGSVDEVTAAAARAGLGFVVVTDHGDATRAPDPPEYRHGVLYVDAVEISTDDGHLVALGLPQAPYPLRGEGRDVLEDVARLGGFAIAAHPGSPKPDLRWTDWSSRIDGLEWLNGDSEWRDERWMTLTRGLLAYPFRPAQALALLLDRPGPVLARWDRLTATRQVVAVAGADAHARIGVRSIGEPYDSRGSLHFPSYENSFREFSVTAPDVAMTGNAAADASALTDAIRRGHVYSTVDALAGPAAFRFTASSDTRRVVMGDAVPSDAPLALRVDTQMPRGGRITLLRDGRPVAEGGGPALRYDAPAEAGVYRVELGVPGAPGTPEVPWLVSNPIYVGRPGSAPPSVARPKARESVIRYSGGVARGWSIEKSPASEGALDVVGTVGGSQLLARFALSGTSSDSPYVAFVMPAAPTMAGYDRLVFTARADRPMRIDVQLRNAAGRRWRRSVFVDQTSRTVQVFLDDMRPVEAASAPDSAPVAAGEVESVLFVVDSLNTKVGSNGEVWLDDVAYAR